MPSLSDQQVQNPKISVPIIHDKDKEEILIFLFNMDQVNN